MSHRVISTASVLVDLPISVGHLPERGGDTLGTATPPTPGGGFNIVAAAARQGAEVGLLSPLGEGRNGQLCRKALDGEGVEHLGAVRASDDTGYCVTLTEPDGERSFITVPGVEAVVTPHDLPDPAQFADDVLFVSGYDLCYPDSGTALGEWVAGLPRNVTVVFDPGPLVDEIPADLRAAVLRRADICTVNEREATLLWGLARDCTDPLREVNAASMDIRRGLGPDAIVLIRVGAQGCVVVDPSAPSAILVPSSPVQAVDSTGAGDAHAGVLMARLVSGWTMLDAVRAANVAAAITVTRPGPATSPTAVELEGFLAELESVSA